MFQTSCIFVYTELSNWKNAQKKCNEAGLHLMTIRNTVNTTQLLDAISLMSGKSHVTFWTGARSIKFHGLYFWEEDDSVVESELWRHGEPHVPFSKRCVYLDTSGELGTWPCFVKRRFLCEAVEPTWYGDRNKFHCQCSQGLCDDIGSCLSGHMQCFPGWFGAKCEYYDVARRQDKTYHVHEDNDPVCEHNLINPYTLNLTSPVPFSFLRVIVTQAVDSTKMNFTLTLRSVKQTCQSTHIRMDHFTYDFICLYGPVYYDQLTLAWPRTVTLCAVYISKGHDVTFQQRVTFEGLKMASPEVVVDSIDSIGSLCTEQIPGETRQTIEIHLGLPQMITQITIARKRGVADYSHMKGLRIETLDTRMQTLVTFQLNSANSDARVVSVLTFDNQTAAKIRISLEAFNEKSFIEICEINAYGECSPPFYGGDCLEVCPASCPYKACHIDDVCLWPCPAGTVGPQCKVPTIAAALNDGPYQAAASAHETHLGYKEIALIVAGVFFACLALVILVMHCLTKAASGVEMSLKEFLRLESEAGQMLHLSSTSIERDDSALSILVERLENAARRQRNAALMKHILSKSLKVDDRSRPAAARHNVSPSIEFDEFDEEDYV
nr:L-selectin-like; partial [Biomphalaria glabrata]